METVDNIIDKKSEKYKTLLKLINDILSNIEKGQIDDLLKFKDITRNDIIKEENILAFNESQEALFNHFDKKNVDGIEGKRNYAYGYKWTYDE